MSLLEKDRSPPRQRAQGESDPGESQGSQGETFTKSQNRRGPFQSIPSASTNILETCTTSESQPELFCIRAPSALPRTGSETRKINKITHITPKIGVTYNERHLARSGLRTKDLREEPIATHR